MTVEIEDYDESKVRSMQVMAALQIQHKLAVLADDFDNDDRLFETCLMVDFMVQSLKVSEAAYYSIVKELTELEAKVISLGVSQPD